MITPEKFVDEKARQQELESYSILDSLPEKDYDNITAIAAEICGTSISLITLIDTDRQWFKSGHGIPSGLETPRDRAFCAHAINEPNKVMIVQDARLDKRFHDHPSVIGKPPVIFYAGVPLLGDDGLPLGTLCVVDNKPKLLSQSQIKSLEALSNQVMNLMKLRRTNLKLETSLKELANKNEELERFAFLAAHDIKSPLNNIANLTELFSMNHGRALGENARHMLEMISNSAVKLRSLVDGLLEYSRSDSILKEKKSDINLDVMIQEIGELFTYENNLEIKLVSEMKSLHMNRAALEQILMNLIANSVKYSDKQITKIEFHLSENPEFYFFKLKDNGPGIEPEYQERIFEIFEIVASSDKFGIRGNGIGLATVKKLVQKLGGEVSVESDKGKGARFKFSIAK